MARCACAWGYGNMPQQGLQVFDDLGRTVLDTTMRTVRVRAYLLLTGAQYPDASAGMYLVGTTFLGQGEKFVTVSTNAGRATQNLWLKDVGPDPSDPACKIYEIYVYYTSELAPLPGDMFQHLIGVM